MAIPHQILLPQRDPAKGGGDKDYGEIECGLIK